MRKCQDSLSIRRAIIEQSSFQKMPWHFITCWIKKGKFSRFVAENLDKIPPIKITNLDAISKFNSIVKVKSMISIQNAEINALKNNNAILSGAYISSFNTTVNTENREETELNRVFCSIVGCNDNVQDYNCKTQVKK